MGISLFKHWSPKANAELLMKMTGTNKEDIKEKMSIEEDGAIYIPSTNTLLTGKDVTTSHYQVKAGTETIAGGAFTYSKVVSIELPESVHSIHERAFRESKNLVEINIPSKIMEICESTFLTCN